MWVWLKATLWGLRIWAAASHQCWLMSPSWWRAWWCAATATRSLSTSTAGGPAMAPSCYSTKVRVCVCVWLSVWERDWHWARAWDKTCLWVYTCWLDWWVRLHIWEEEALNHYFPLWEALCATMRKILLVITCQHNMLMVAWKWQLLSIVCFIITLE